MRPYIGILIDSFWEAVGNKVLWASLLAWTFLLACLAPFGYVTEQSFLLTNADIDNRSQLIEKIAKASKGQGTDSAKAVAALLDAEFVEEIRQAADDDSKSLKRSELAKGLNVAVKSRELYTEDAFPTAAKRKRLQPLLEQDVEGLSEEDVIELNRELLQLAYPLELSHPRGEQLWIGYAGFKIGNALPISRRQIDDFLEPFILQFIIKFGLAVLAVFVAIIVTSPIIPDTFRSGSLHLMLSKPISRVWLYLSKFFGGTVFVFVNITFVLIGLYFIAGMRFDIWNSGLLMCIPLLLFVFVIFYSISGLAGLLWGNPIVCVVSCMVFWFICFCLGFAKQAMMPWVEINPQIAKVKKIEDHVTVLTESGDFNVWNEEYSVWQPGILTDGRGGPKKTFGPIYDPDSRKILLKSFVSTPFGGTFARSRELNVIDLDDIEETPVADESAETNMDLSDSAADEMTDRPNTSSESKSSEGANSEKVAEQAPSGPVTNIDDVMFGGIESLPKSNPKAEQPEVADATSDDSDSHQAASKDAASDGAENDGADSDESASEPSGGAVTDDSDADTLDQDDSKQGDSGQNDSALDDAFTDELETEESSNDESIGTNADEISAAADTTEQEEEGPKSASDARKEARWVSDEGPSIPTQCFGILEVGDSVVAICRAGLYKLDMKRLQMMNANEDGLLSFLKIGALLSNSAFENIAPKGYFLAENSSTSAIEDGSGLIVFNAGTVDVLRLKDGEFEVEVSHTLDTEDADNTEAALVQMNENYCVIVRDELPIEILDASLNPVRQLELGKELDVKQLRWIPGTDTVSIVTHTGELLKLDCESASLTTMELPVYGSVTAVNWLSSDEGWVGIKPNRVYLVNLASQEIQEGYEPTPSILDRIYGWGIKPLYNIFPKPAALDDAMLYVLTGNDTQTMNVINNDLGKAKVELDVWPPILANMAFVIVVLAISCVYIARKEF